jgi:hypothetical protein
VEDNGTHLTANATYYAAIYRAGDDHLYNTEYSGYRFTGPNCP